MSRRENALSLVHAKHFAKSFMIRVTIVLLIAMLTPYVPADEPSNLTAGLLPNSTVAYLEIHKPQHILATILDHPIAAKVQSLEEWKKATREQGYRNFLTARKFFEVQFGMDWRPALEALTAGGISAAYDEISQGFIVIVRGRDAETMETFRSRILELTRLNARESEIPEPYRDLPVYRVENGGAVVVREWLLLTNKPELGRQVVDRLLDDDAAKAEAEHTLVGVPEFQEASNRRTDDAVAWGFVNLTAVRKNDKVIRALEQQTENPLAELLVGGIQSVLRNAPYITSTLKLDSSRLDLQFETSLDASWIPESRQFYFGEQLDANAASLPEIPETILTLSTYRDVSQMWLRAGDLFDEKTNDQLAEADSTLSTIFSGKDFGEDILGAFAPSFGIVVARQSFANAKPVPAIRLPSFGLVGTLKDPDSMRPDLRRMFQNAVGFFNIVGAQNGNPQLEMDMKKEGDLDMITSRYLPEKKDADSTTAPMIFNFTPTVAFRGTTFILASTQQLAESLAAADPPPDNANANTSVRLFAEPLKSTLEDNREQLISQNMLQEGHSREEAEAAIALIVEFIGHIRQAGLDLTSQDHRLRLHFHLEAVANP